MNLATVPGIIAVLWLAVGCSSSDHASDQTTPEQGSLRFEEDLRIGAVDGPAEFLFSSVTRIEEGPAGEIYVLDGGASTVRIFSGTGEFVGTVGRQGEGPGEFMLPSVIGVSGDTLVVLDPRLTPSRGRARLHVFLADGSLLRSADFGRERWSPIGVVSTPEGWLVQVSSRARTGDTSRATGSSVRGPIFDSIAVERLSIRADTVSPPLLKMTGRETYSLGQLGWFRSPLFSPRAQIVMTSSGTIFTTAGDEFRIEARNQAGATIRVIERELERIPVTAADFQTQRDLEIENAKARPASSETAPYLAMLEDDYPQIPTPPYRAIVGRLLAAPGGSLLVERLDLDPLPFEATKPTYWDYVDADGQVLGSLTTPPNVVPLKLTDAHLYARVRDELDVSYAVRFRIVATSDGAEP